MGVMYNYMTLNDGTTIEYAEISSGVVKVYVETADINGDYKYAYYSLPQSEWEEVCGYSDKELDFLKTLIDNNAQLIIELSYVRCIKVYKFGKYIVYFGAHDSGIRNVHVHVAKDKVKPESTKIWITSKGQALMCNDHSDIEPGMLSIIIKNIESNKDFILDKWIEQYGDIHYCS
jgi:hypothetical protein